MLESESVNNLPERAGECDSPSVSEKGSPTAP